MDERGFVFTTDAILALVVFFVFTASILTYYTLPSYMGADHQHLETQAADALEVMTYDGTIYSAAAQLASNNTTIQNKGKASLNTELEYLLNGNGTNNNTAYKLSMTLENGTTVSVENNKTIGVSKDTVTRVIVISGPKQGWLGRAWYKIEEVQFDNQKINSTTTLWNFHNWLTNFAPYKSSGLASAHFWGNISGNLNSPQNIQFSFPTDANITGAYFLTGSNNKVSSLSAPSFGVNLTINGFKYNINNASFNKLYYRPGTGTPGYPIFNNLTIVPSSSLLQGVNNFNVNFTTPVANTHDMPWFAIIGNYSNTIPVPQGILTRTFRAPDAAGMAVPGTSGYYKTYNLTSGVVTNYTGSRSIYWSQMINQNSTYSNGLPFDLLNVNGGSEDGCAVSTTHDIYIPANARLYDAYTVINAYGGVDNALVEVWNGSQWNTTFCSFDQGVVDFSARSDGYGNTPGILDIRPYLTKGVTNKVRITIWDNVPGQDYDLVGLINCYSTVTYSQLPIKWDTYAFPSYQNSTNITRPEQSFDIGGGAEKLFLFLGTGVDTRRVAVEIKNNTSTYKTIYNDTTVPYVLDIGNLDLQNGTPIIASGTVGNYTGKPGLNYKVRVSVYSSPSWQSGDGASSPPPYSNAEVYSGTRVGVVYPKFLENMWATDFADDAATAQQLALNNLTDALDDANYTYNVSDIKTEALYTGNLPNSITVRLDLWRS
jgi:hypothetical protein